MRVHLPLRSTVLVVLLPTVCTAVHSVHCLSAWGRTWDCSDGLSVREHPVGGDREDGANGEVLQIAGVGALPKLHTSPLRQLSVKRDTLGQLTGTLWACHFCACSERPVFSKADKCSARTQCTPCTARLLREQALRHSERCGALHQPVCAHRLHLVRPPCVSRVDPLRPEPRGMGCVNRYAGSSHHCGTSDHCLF